MISGKITAREMLHYFSPSPNPKAELNSNYR